MKVSDFIVEFFNKRGIDTLFTITGGFAMHLNDSFGNSGKYNIYYQHHEQACGYAAVGYSKTNSKPVIVCTTAGTAATNTISGCLVAHQDSLPILFISGQVKSTESIRKINTEKMKLRHYAGADCDIISMVKPITKYAAEILDVNDLIPVLKEAFYNLSNGRLGPVWLSIPIDIQSMLIDIKETDYLLYEHVSSFKSTDFSLLDNLNELLKNSKRPLIIAGNGIKLGNACEKFNEFIEKYQIPVVVTLLSTDIIETANPSYSGKIGLIGDRHGNFTLQNCDLLISLGCRMAQGLIGYRSDWFAREAKIVYIDNDENEIQKENLNYELKINMDVNDFFDNANFQKNNYSEWIEKCNHWKNKWIFELPPYIEDKVNPYHVLKSFYSAAPENKITIACSGSIVTNVWHMINIKKGDKFLHSSQGDMGFELPCAIGAQIAEPKKTVISILGEGSFQLNIQELQTIIQYKLPIKILLFNNGAYGAIEITQTNFFKNKFGVDKSSGISFPDTEKVVTAYGIKYISINTNDEIESKIKEFLEYNSGPIILEVFCCIQSRYPRLNAIKNEDGTFTNRPFEDMDPFLDREEFKREMIVDIV
jgi:acetolactate synthase-1/2/3 large subunit